MGDTAAVQFSVARNSEGGHNYVCTLYLCVFHHFAAAGIVVRLGFVLPFSSMPPLSGLGQTESMVRLRY